MYCGSPASCRLAPSCLLSMSIMAWDCVAVCSWTRARLKRSWSRASGVSPPRMDCPIPDTPASGAASPPKPDPAIYPLSYQTRVNLETGLIQGLGVLADDLVGVRPIGQPGRPDGFGLLDGPSVELGQAVAVSVREADDPLGGA